MSSDGNHTHPNVPSLDNPTSTIWAFILFCAVAVVGIFANVFLIITIYKQQSLRRAPTYVALMCLAMVDGFHLLFLVCAGVLYTNAKTSTFCQILNFGMYFMTGVSSYHMVIFSALRYLILVKPFFAMKYVTLKNTLCSCLMCWLVFLCVAGLAFFTMAFGKIETSDGKVKNTCVITEDGKYMEIVVFIIEYCIPLVLISGFHVSKCVHLKRRSVESANTPTQKQQVSTAIIVTIIVLYVICYFPLGIYVTVTQILESPVASSVYSLSYLFIVLTPINSALNPFVYFFFKKCVHKGKSANINVQTSSPHGTKFIIKAKH